MITKNLVFLKENGKKIAAKAYLPGDGRDKYKTAIFSHGFGGCYKDLEHHGEAFAQRGIACVFIDFCGGGMRSESDGNMLEMTVLTEMEDLREAIAHVEKLEFVLPNELSLIGESQGGFVSAMVAAQLPEKINKLVLWYPALVIPDDSRRRFAEGDNTCFGTPLSPDYNAASKDIDVFAEIPKYRGPVKIIHGDKDTVVPISYSNRAVEVYENAELLVIEGAGHGFDGEDSKLAGKVSAEFLL